MAKKTNKLTVIRMLSLDGPNGTYKPWDEFSEEEHNLFAVKSAEKIGKVLSGCINRRETFDF